MKIEVGLTIRPTRVGEQFEHVKKTQSMLDKHKKENHF